MASKLSEHPVFSPRNHKRFCVQCRTAEDDLDSKKLLQCVRCKTGIYCSRECQKKNWPMHKRICKKLEVTWAEYDNSCKKFDEAENADSEDEGSGAIDHKMSASSHLGMALIEFAYFSTDTVERGASICENAMRKLMWCTDRSLQSCQNVQCLLVLAVCLGYDDGALKIIALLHHVNNHSITEDSPEFKDFFSHICMDELQFHSPAHYKGPGPDLIYTCLLLIRMRQLAHHRANTKKQSSTETEQNLEDSVRAVVDVCIEKCRWVLDCIPPDGDQLKAEASNELFGNTTCWLLIQDCFVLSPGVIYVFLEFSPDYEVLGESLGAE
jgi:hypothetical protein